MKYNKETGCRPRENAIHPMSRTDQQTDRPENSGPEPATAAISPAAPIPPPAGSSWLGSRWAVRLAASLIALATLAAYANSFQGAFVFDDDPAIRDNPTVRRLWRIGEVLSPPARGETVSGRPLVNLSLAINYRLGGMNAWGYHAVNLAIHILAAWTLLGILRRTFLLPAPVAPARLGIVRTDRLPAVSSQAVTPLALAIALLWAVHPLQTESVTYIVQRAESLAGLFYLLTLYCAIRGGTPGGPPGHAGDTSPDERSETPKASAKASLWHAGAVLACLLGMATKEVMVTAPLIVLLYDRTFLAASFRQALRRRPGLYLGLAATWGLLAYLVLATGLLGKSAGYGAPQAVSTWDYLRSQPAVILYYLRLFVWPHPLCLDYGRQMVIASNARAVLPSLVVIVACIAAMVWGVVLRKGWAILGAWFFVILAPSSLVPLSDLAFEHRVYLPFAAFVTSIMLCAYHAGMTLSRHRVFSQPVLIATGAFLAISLAVGLGILTARRNADYRSPLSIWASTVATVPGNDRAQSALGNVLIKEGRPAEAMRCYEIALRIRPDRVEDRICHGVALMQQDRIAEAIADFEQALQINPRHAMAHCNLAAALDHQGKPAEAIEHFQTALAINPNYLDAHFNIANAMVRQGRLAEAVAHYQKAVAITPNDWEARNNLADALYRQGKIHAALGQWREVIRFQSTDIALLNKMAWVLATNPDASVRDGAEAVQLAERATGVSDRSDPAVLDTLAAAYAEAGQFAEAVRTGEQALQLAVAVGNRTLAEKIRTRADLYRSGKPYRQPPSQ